MESIRELVLEAIGRQPAAWVRVAAVRNPSHEPWKLKLLEVVTGSPLSGWEARSWQYPDALFDSYEVTGSAVAEALRTGVVRVCGEEVPTVQEFQLQAPDRRQAGGATFLQVPDWPTTEIKLHLFDLSSQVTEPQGHLISERGDPSFVSFYKAAASFFWYRCQPGGGQVQTDAVYRHQDRAARINAVRWLVARSALEVTVEGYLLDGLVVELAGDEPGASVVLASPPDPPQPEKQVTVFELSGGLPEGAWVLLRRGSEWVDRRFLTFPYTRDNEPGVIVVSDQATRLEVLLADWERVGVEFKRQVPTQEESKLRLMKSVCGFANGTGGSILIGVDDDDRSFHGLDPRSLDRIQAQLDQMIRSWIEPYPTIHFETLPIPNGDLVVLELAVEAGATLYGCGPSGARRPYVRHHSITEVAAIGETVTIARRGTEVPIPGWLR